VLLGLFTLLMALICKISVCFYADLAKQDSASCHMQDMCHFAVLFPSNLTCFLDGTVVALYIIVFGIINSKKLMSIIAFEGFANM